MSRVLVTGGAGFIGGRVCAVLQARGCSVVALDDLSMGTRARVPEGCDLVVGDVRDPAALTEALGGVDVVVHLAARVTIRGSVDALFDDYDVNVAGTVQLLAALPGTTVKKLVYASSMAVYADSDRGVPVGEDHATEPRSPYGAGKLAAEHYCRAACAELGIDQISLRYFNTWGPGQTLTPYVGVITIFVNRLLDGASPVIFGDGTQTRDFIHVDDVAEATALAVEADVRHAVLNVGTGRGTTVSQVARSACDALAPDLDPEHEPARPEELRFSVADASKAHALLGWRTHRDLDLTEVIDHWRTHR